MSIFARIWVHDAGRRQNQMGQMSSALEPNVMKLARLKPSVHFFYCGFKERSKC